MKRLPAFLLAALPALAGAAGVDALERPLAAAGDAVRGRGLFAARDGGHCVICHAVSGLAPAGSVGPALDGIAGRMSAAQIRQRIVDITQVNPEAAMPAFFRTEGLARVAAAYAGRPMLDGQQVEDLVAFLASLR